MSDYYTLDDLQVSNKTVLLRCDLNLPMLDGRATDLSRIHQHKATINELLKKGAKLVLLSHFGRPKGKASPECSLAQVILDLENVLGQSVAHVGRVQSAAETIKAMRPGGIVLLENLRFDDGEEANDEDFAKSLAEVGDIFVNDAFSISHRAHASVVGVPKLLPHAMGRAMEREVSMIETALFNAQHPMMAVVGGAKVSTKLDVLENLLGRVDYLFVAGGMANTFLAAQGYPIGKSLYEEPLMKIALKILAEAERYGCEIILPSDVVITDKIEAGAKTKVVPINRVDSASMIADVGPGTIAELGALLKTCKTVLWNGPLGVFEVPPFDRGTVGLADIVAELTQKAGLVSIAGGGDTLAALNAAHAKDKVTFASTAGGAFLEWLEGKSLPGVEALRKPN